MADDDKAPAPADATDQSPEGAASAAPDPEKVIADLTKRQSGADKARDIAIAERDEARRQYEALLAGKSSVQDPNKPKDEATIRAEVAREYDERLARERATDLAKVLDTQFPVARKKFPGLTDAAQLAELEEVFGDRAPAPPTPIGNNPPKDAGGSKNIDDMSVAELRASLDAQVAGLFKG
jgi:hypothetical protein